jgi:hypothetical protein
MCGPRHLTSVHRHRLEWQYPDRLAKSRLTPLIQGKSVGFEAAGHRETAFVLLSTVDYPAPGNAWLVLPSPDVPSWTRGNVSSWCRDVGKQCCLHHHA